MSEGPLTPERPEPEASSTRPPLWVHAGALLLAGASLFQLGLLYRVFFGRLFFPLDVEWMEGGMLCHALRLMEGRPLYGPPSVEFIPFLYTPLYPVLLAALGQLVGLTYSLGRLLSILAFTGVLGLLFESTRRLSGRGVSGVLWGLGACGLAASSFPHTYGWYDLVRSDSLYLVLVTGCLFLLAFHGRRSLGAVLGAALLAGLAFLTKQTALLFILYAGATLLVIAWRRLPAFVAVVGLVAGGTTLVWNRVSSGWFWTYIYKMHQGHDLYWDRIWPVTEKHLLEFFPVVGAVLGLWLLAGPIILIRRRSLRPDDRGRLFWLGVALTGIAVSAVGYATQWASYNAFIPGLLFPGLFAAMAGADLVCKASSSDRLSRRVLACSLGIVVGGGLAGQLVHQRYTPAKHLPDDRDRRTGEALIAQLARIPGPVLMPYHPFYPYLAGKRPSYHQMGINDITRAGHMFPPDIMLKIDSQEYAAVLLDNPPQGRYDFLLGPYKLGHYFRWGTVPRPITGYEVRPTYLFVPARPEPVPEGVRRVFDCEDANWQGWTVQGSAFGDGPVTGAIWGQGPVGPYQGRRLINSFHGGDTSQGLVRSPPFTVDRPFAGYRVGGGQQPGLLEVRLLLPDGRAVHVGTGTNADIMEERRVDLRAHLGQTLRLELEDRATGSWGHLLFDDLTLQAR